MARCWRSRCRPARCSRWSPKAAAIAKAAEQAGIPATDDFNRGDSVYDNYYGDPTLKNPCIDAIDKGPYYGVRVEIGDSELPPAPGAVASPPGHWCPRADGVDRRLRRPERHPDRRRARADRWPTRSSGSGQASCLFAKNPA